MAKQLDLQARFTADTKDLKKGSKEAKEAIKSFETDAKGFLDTFAGLFGTSMGQISASLNSVKGAFLVLNQTVKGSTAAAGVFSKAMGIIKAALVSTGIGAIVVALGSLIAYLTKTQEGADKLRIALVPFKVIFNNLIDLASALGEKIVWVFTHPVDAIKGLWDLIKSQIVNRFQGLIETFSAFGSVIEGVFTLDKDKIEQGAKEARESLLKTLTGMEKDARENLGNSIAGSLKKGFDEIKTGISLEERRQQLEKDKIEFIKRRADIEKEVSELRLKVEDRLNYKASERLEFNNKALELQKQLGEEEVRLATEAYEIKVAQDELANNMNADNEETANLYAEMLGTQTRTYNALKEMTTKQTELTNQVKAEEESMKKIEESARRRRMIEMGPLEKIEMPQSVQNPIVKVDIKPELSEEGRQSLLDSIKPIEQQMLDLSGIINSGIESLAVGIGESLGLLLSGEGGLENFTAMVASTFADMAIQVGKIAIQMGVALLAIKLSLESINPYVAIAAGIALVALGTLVKSSLSKVASGASGASASVSAGPANMGSGYGVNGTGGYSSDDNEINITGELVARGDTLVAVLQKAEKRKSITGK